MFFFNKPFLKMPFLPFNKPFPPPIKPFEGRLQRESRFPIKPFGNDRGQIFPFLLICLVALIVATAAIIGMGESAKTMTCADNAADAGSLAAASGWAAAFNKLVDRNKDTANSQQEPNSGQYMNDPKLQYQYYKRMNKYYVEMRDRYRDLYNGTQGGTNKGANDYLREALQHSRNAEDFAKQALGENTNNSAPINDCQEWDDKPGADLNKKAADEALEAAKCIGAYKVLAQYMQQITDFFKDKQAKNFCEAKDWMDKAYDKSRKTGLSYAFSNSCTTTRLGSSAGEDFNYWLETGNFYDNKFDNPPNKMFYLDANDDPDFQQGDKGCVAKYQWDLGKTRCGDGKCGIRVILDLPKISTYELKHTKWNYPQKKILNVITITDISGIPNGTSQVSEDPFNTKASFELMEDMKKVSEYLKTKLPADGLAISQKTDEGVDCCQRICDNPEDSYDCHDKCEYVSKYVDARNMKAALIEHQQRVIDWLHAVNSRLDWWRNKDNVPVNNLTIPTLQEWNTNIFDNVWPLAQDTQNPVQSFVNNDTICDNVKQYSDSSGYSGMTIINIDSVTLDQWTTKCTVDIFCKNLLDIQHNKCIPESHTYGYSTSQFDGGDMGAFKDDYYSRIVGTTKD